MVIIDILNIIFCHFVFSIPVHLYVMDKDSKAVVVREIEETGGFSVWVGVHKGSALSSFIDNGQFVR